MNYSTNSTTSQPARGLAFGTQTWQEDFTVWGWDGCGDVEDSVSGVNSNEDGTLTFVRPLGLSVGQPLIFTLEGLTYATVGDATVGDATVGDATVDVSQVRFKLGGDWHDPVAVTNNAAGGWDVSYVLVVGTDLLGTNTIGQGNFIWPSSSSNYTESGCVDNPCPYGPPCQWNETFTTHHLSFRGFHNGKFHYKGKFAEDYERVINCWFKNLPQSTLLQKVLFDLVESKDTYTIDQLTGRLDQFGHQLLRPRTVGSSNWPWYVNDPPSTSYIDAKTYTFDNRTWTFPQALAHELLHAHDFFLKQPWRDQNHTDPGWIEEERQVTDEAASVGCQ